MDEFDVLKIRRFTLVSAILLIFYVSTGMSLKNDELHILNNIFKFEKQWLFPIILLAVTLYGMIRFIYYGVIANPHPVKARKLLKDDKIPIEGWDGIQSEGGAQKADFDIKRRQLYNQQVAKYFPGITCRENENWKDSIKRSTKFMYFLHDLDYYSPIWISIVGIVIYLVSLK